MDRLRERVIRFASGLSRINDFSVAAWAGHPIGVEVGELSAAAVRELARVIVDFGAATKKLDMAEHVHDCIGRLLADLLINRSKTVEAPTNGAR